MSVKDRGIAIVAEQAVLEPSDVTMESTLEDLGIDSPNTVTVEVAYDLNHNAKIAIIAATQRF